jgi:imidazolonepropionase-like amidohydrolase
MLAIVNGKVLTVTGGTIENGTVLIENGKITSVGSSRDITVPKDAEIIDASGKWVTPGLIDAHTHISTFGEPNSMEGRYDGNEITSPNTSYVRGIDALNPHDMAIGEARKAGFTTCYTGPGSANIIGGTGIGIKLKDGNTIFDIAIPECQHMKMALGENPRSCYGEDNKLPSTRMGNAAVLREALYNAKVYSDALKAAETDPSKAPKPDFKLDALVPVVRGERFCRIHCHRADDIVTAIRIGEEYNLKFSIEHCTEGYKIKDFLAEKGVTCVIGPVNMEPYKMEIWGCKLETPGILEKAGVNICLTQDTQSATKWLPMFVGACIARGLSYETALKAVTINPAKLLGLEGRVGSIEPGKDGDVAIFSGDPFSNYSICETTIIEGVVYNNK